ncbi:MAG: MFS transporter [Chloroflexi bacterium]|nr:MFS transporter [Chloroflexota bacterium]
MVQNKTITPRRTDRWIILLAFAAFISIGLPDGLLGVAWPSMHSSFSVRLDQLGILLAALVIGFLVSTSLSGALLAWLGIGRLLAASAGLTGLALIGYTIVPLWGLLLALAVCAGLGAGAIDAGLNNVIARRYRRLLYLLHAMFGLGAALGPWIMTASLQLSTWRSGYVIVGTLQILLAAAFLITAKRWDDSPKPEQEAIDETPQASLIESLRLPRVWAGILMFVIYTGLEVSVGQWSFTLLTESRGVQVELAGFFVGLFWGTLTVGRLLSTWIADLLGERRFLRLSFIGIALGSLLMLLNLQNWLSLAALPLIGFAMAPVFPALIGSTDERVGQAHVSNAIGFQVGAAALGGALLPGLAGIATRIATLEAIALTHVAGAFIAPLMFEGISRMANRTVEQIDSQAAPPALDSKA